MYPVFFVDFEDNLNLFNQHDDMFFIGQSYGGNARNKILSSLIPDSSKIDTVVKNLNTKLSSQKSKYEFFDDSIKTTNSILEKTEADFAQYEALKKECTILCDKIVAAEALIKNLESIQAKLQTTEPKMKFVEKVAKIAPAIEKLQAVALTGITMEHEASDIKFLGERISKVSKKASIVTQEFEEIEISPILLRNNAISRLETLERTFKTIDNTISTNTDMLGANTRAIAERRELLKNTLCPIINDSFCDKCKKILCKGQ
jgi:hypothetical protein